MDTDIGSPDAIGHGVECTYKMLYLPGVDNLSIKYLNYYDAVYT